MSAISQDEFRKIIEWARINGGLSHEPNSSKIRVAYQGKTYVIPAELLDTKAGSSHHEVDLDAYLVS